MRGTVDILGIHIDAINLDLAFEKISLWVSQKNKVYVCVAPVSTVMSCQDSQEYKNIINSADMVTPDGMPLVWIGKLKGFKNISRTYGPDLMHKVCDEGQGRGIKHFFYGGSSRSNELLGKKLRQLYPAIKVVGQYAPAFTDTIDEDIGVINRINETNADVLWVSLGSPKQDFWMAKYREHLNVPVIVGVGAAFDFISGVKPQAPPWMQQLGLEWFFRLCCEPRRLWKRYLIGNTRFILLLIRSLIFKRFFIKI